MLNFKKGLGEGGLYGLTCSWGVQLIFIAANSEIKIKKKMNKKNNRFARGRFLKRFKVEVMEMLLVMRITTARKVEVMDVGGGYGSILITHGAAIFGRLAKNFIIINL